MGFQLAIELDVPEELRRRLPSERDFRIFRYEVAIREEKGETRIASEQGLLMPLLKQEPRVQRELFPDPPTPPSTMLIGGGLPGKRTVLSKSPEGTDSSHDETATKPGKGWVTNIAMAGGHNSESGTHNWASGHKWSCTVHMLTPSAAVGR